MIREVCRYCGVRIAKHNQLGWVHVETSTAATHRPQPANTCLRVMEERLEAYTTTSEHTDTNHVDSFNVLIENIKKIKTPKGSLCLLGKEYTQGRFYENKRGKHKIVKRTGDEGKE